MPSPSTSSRGRGPTIRDVARRAGVSVATVSRVINDSPLVLEPTRARVQAAVDELGYRLNATARNLSIGRAMAVGVVVPFFTTPSVIERLRGVVERLGRGRAARVRPDALRRRGARAARRRAARPRPPRPRRRPADHLAAGLRRARSTRSSATGCRPCSSTRVHPRLPRVVIDNVRGGELAASTCWRADTGGSGSSETIPTNAVRVHLERGSPASGSATRCERAGVPLDPALERFGPHGRDEAGALADELLALARSADRDLRRLRPAGHRRAQGGRAPRRAGARATSP